jgi:hypothetical protein
MPVARMLFVLVFEMTPEQCETAAQKIRELADDAEWNAEANLYLKTAGNLEFYAQEKREEHAAGKNWP